MRRIQLMLLMIVAMSAGGTAQFGPLPASVPSSDALIARVMSFDRDGDGKVVDEELIERMKGLVARGDANGDRALDRGEIANLATRPVPSEGGRVMRFPTYQLPLDTWFPDRSHIEGALADLKLPGVSYANALAAVDVHGQHVDATARRVAGDLLRQMESVLTIEQLADLHTALESQRTMGVVNFSSAIAASSNGVVVRNAVLRFDAQNPLSTLRRFIRFSGGDLARFVDHFALPPEKSSAVHAAIERYKEKLQVAGEQERACLVEQMNDIMSDVERDDFRAALARRHAVPAGIAGIVTRMRGVISAAPPIAAPAN